MLDDRGDEAAPDAANSSSGPICENELQNTFYTQLVYEQPETVSVRSYVFPPDYSGLKNGLLQAKREQEIVYVPPAQDEKVGEVSD